MNFSSSQHISQQTVQPVSESAQLPANATPGSTTAYNTVHQEEVDKREGNQSGADKRVQTEAKTEDGEGTPEIFKLLKNYRFKDFLRLSLGEDESTLTAIIKKKRQSRGVSQSRPVSAGHSQSDTFINQIASQYLHTGWLMDGKPGKVYSGSL